RRNIRRRITIPLTLSNLKLLRRITRTENILHRNFTRRQVAIQNRVASNIGISQSTFSVKRSEERRVGKEGRAPGAAAHEKEKREPEQPKRAAEVKCGAADTAQRFHAVRR